MSQTVNPAAALLIAASGNWRNALYISCARCKQAGTSAPGFLMIPGADAKPLLLAESDMERTLGTAIDKEECAAILSCAQFNKLYASWLTWTMDEPACCALGWLAGGCPTGHAGEVRT